MFRAHETMVIVPQGGTPGRNQCGRRYTHQRFAHVVLHYWLEWGQIAEHQVDTALAERVGKVLDKVASERARGQASVKPTSRKAQKKGERERRECESYCLKYVKVR